MNNHGLKFYGMFLFKTLDWGDNFKFKKTGSIYKFIEIDHDEIVYETLNGKTLRRGFSPEQKAYYYSYPA